jgi:hypothetical protein
MENLIYIKQNNIFYKGIIVDKASLYLHKLLDNFHNVSLNQKQFWEIQIYRHTAIVVLF